MKMRLLVVELPGNIVLSPRSKYRCSFLNFDAWSRYYLHWSNFFVVIFELLVPVQSLQKALMVNFLMFFSSHFESWYSKTNTQKYSKTSFFSIFYDLKFSSKIFKKITFIFFQQPLKKCVFDILVLFDHRKYVF